MFAMTMKLSHNVIFSNLSLPWGMDAIEIHNTISAAYYEHSVIMSQAKCPYKGNSHGICINSSSLNM